MTGTVTISVEVELGWGSHDRQPYEHLSEDATAEFEDLSFLTDLCDEYEIPISFNVVGHLFHDSCTGSHVGPYPYGW